MFHRAAVLSCQILVTLTLLCTLTSCASLLTNTVIYPTVGNLQRQTDLDLVCEGAPAYLLMIDSMIASDPDSRALLEIGAQSYSAYTVALAECKASRDRIAALAGKAYLYGTGLIGQVVTIAPGGEPEEFRRQLARVRKSQVPQLFWGTMGWLTWVRQQQGAPAAMADLVVIERVMTRILELDETFQAGSVHLFFGGYYASRPTMLGGDLEESRSHFEEALAISDRRFLSTQVTYAETFARQAFDQKLHDHLLKEVLDFPLDAAPEFALSNQIAKRKARRLLEEGYFDE